MVIGYSLSNYHLPTTNYPWLFTEMGKLLIFHS